MNLYDGIKDAASLIDKAHNIELYQKLVDLSAQAVDLQSQVNTLTEENKNLKQQLEIKKKVIRHKEHYITLEGDDLLYCANCWDVEGKLVQLTTHPDNGSFYCAHCKDSGVYDHSLFDSSNDETITQRNNGYIPY